MRTNSAASQESHEDKLHRTKKDPKSTRSARRNKSTRSSKETICPFDPYHVIDENYLDRHIVNCASSANIENCLYDVKPIKEAGVVPLDRYKNLTVPVMQDWEEENVLTYDPYINTQGRKVIRYLVLVPKAKKKLFRQTERLRIQLLEKVDADGTNKEVHDMIRNLGQDSLWEILIMYMRRLDIECCETIMENIDFEKLVISEPYASPVKERGKEAIEEVLNIEVDKLMNNGTKVERNRRASFTDSLLTDQFKSLILTVPQE